MNEVSLLEKYNINYLMHFSSIYNLESILKNGIMSISAMKSNNIEYYNTDQNRFDNQLDMISISLDKINNRMLYKKKMNNKRALNLWYILILDINLLNDQNCKALYCKSNAASSDIYNILRSDKDRLKSMESLVELLESKDNQKEILIQNKIDIKYIKGIVVENNNDIDMVKYIVKKLNMDIPVNVNKNMFY